MILYRNEKEMIMNRNEETPNPWDTPVEGVEEEKPAKAKAKAKPKAQANEEAAPVEASTEWDFDMEGLMSDFPTATELERFVYDVKGVVLALKGRANKLKYQVAMDVLNGVEVDPKFIGSENPYLDKVDLVPEDPLKDAPAKDPAIPSRTQLQNEFYSPFVPHPDFEMRSQDKKVHCMFRKYNNGLITYEVMGPLAKRPIGEKLDKYGRTRPEKVIWIDPRTGEQIVQRSDGTLTPQGKRLRAMMQAFKVNKSNHWDTWIDREFISTTRAARENPWDLGIEADAQS